MHKTHTPAASAAPGGADLEACLVGACRAFAAGCRFSMLEPGHPVRRSKAPASAAAPLAQAVIRPLAQAVTRADPDMFAPEPLAPEPLVTATYEAEFDDFDAHPLAGEAAYLRRGAPLDLAGNAPNAAPPRAPRTPEHVDGPGAELVFALRQAIEHSGWSRFLTEKTGGPIRRHEAFSVALAGCPNACSNPHIADVGLIAVWRPEVDAPRCTGAGHCADKRDEPACAAACPEKAITFTKEKPVIERKTCLDCGRCVRACPALALSSGPHGWRVYLGGRLGRHPRLAASLPGLFQTQDLPRILDVCLNLHMKYYRSGARFSDTALAHKSRLLKLLAAPDHF